MEVRRGVFERVRFGGPRRRARRRRDIEPQPPDSEGEAKFDAVFGNGLETKLNNAFEIFTGRAVPKLRTNFLPSDAVISTT